jgi:hypothetical protein
VVAGGFAGGEEDARVGVGSDTYESIAAIRCGPGSELRNLRPVSLAASGGGGAYLHQDSSGSAAVEAERLASAAIEDGWSGGIEPRVGNARVVLAHEFFGGDQETDVEGLRITPGTDALVVHENKREAILADEDSELAQASPLGGVNPNPASKKRVSSGTFDTARLMWLRCVINAISYGLEEVA